MSFSIVEYDKALAVRYLRRFKRSNVACRIFVGPVLLFTTPEITKSTESTVTVIIIIVLELITTKLLVVAQSGQQSRCRYAAK